jgi:formate hydrogenlyase transcriptional activator
MLARAREGMVNDPADRLRWSPPPDPDRSELRCDDVSRVFRLAVEQVPHGVMIFGDDGEVLAANRAAETVFAYAPGQLVGQSSERLLPESSHELHTKPWKRCWTNPQNRTLGAGRPLAGVRSDGEVVPLEISLKALVDGPRRYVVASVTDVSERLRVEARLVAATSDQMGIERLIADLAARFVTMDADAIDDSVVDSMRQIAEVLQLDRALMWRQDPDQASAVASHYWIKHPQPSVPEPLQLASGPFIAAKLEAGEAAWFTRIDEVPDPVDRDALLQHELRSAAVVPMALSGVAAGVRGALAFGSSTTECEWAPAIIEQLRIVSGVFGQALARKTSEKALQRALGELYQLRERMTEEDVQCRPTVKVLGASRLIVSEGAAIRDVLAQVEQVAPTPSTVLLLGETGVGKQVFAETIHELSQRHQRQMIRVSCAAIPSALIESELFGRERGAYTGALTRQIGRFETANQSTLFLDEIGELSAEVQVKLLRVLEERVIERLGSPQPIKVDVRIIAATNRNLEKAVEDKSFREDLFYRLNVFPIVVPPLRERVEDIPGLVWEFVNEFSKSLGKPIESISKESMRQLQLYPWPGNVRELRNVIERAVIIATGPRLTVAMPQPAVGRQPQASSTLKNLEIEHIRATLMSTNWRIRGAGGAAERLGLKPTTLETRMAKLGVTRPKQA